MSINRRAASDEYFSKDDENTLKKMYSKTKDGIFTLFFVLLRENEFSFYYYSLISIIQFLQLIVFAFHPTIAKVWGNVDITDVVYQVLGYFEIVTYMEKTNWSAYIVCFYIAFAAVLVILLGAVFTCYQFAQNKLPHSWIVNLIRHGLLLFSTMLFLPLFEYFITVTACVKNENGVSVHSYFSEVVCWEGAHLIHSVFSIVISILFVATAFITSFVFFEYKSTSNDATARLSSRPNVFLNFYQMILIISLTFFTEEQFTDIILALIFLGSILIFIKFNRESSYHQELTLKLWSIISSLVFWTGIMVVFAKILERIIFAGSAVAWLFGSVFIILVILTDRDNRINLLLVNTNKLSNSLKIQKQINYLLKLAQWELHDKNARALLNGYIEIHKQICLKDDCPLNPGSSKMNIFNKKLLDKNELFSERYSLVVHLVYKLYQETIRKFPLDNSLRLSFSFFLMERMLNKQQALQELNMIDQSKLLWDEQFIIFRYRKIIEDDMTESQKEGQQGLDTVSEMTFQTLFRQLQIDVERSSLLHMEFWSQLLEDNPDLAKLSDIGSKINSAAQSIDETWGKLMKINSNNDSSLKLYGKYLIEIINDKELGNDLLDRARKTVKVQNTKRMIDETGENIENSNNEAIPMMWVSGEQEKFAMITGVNLAAASLFGYGKGELLNRKLDTIMPQALARCHDSFIHNYIKTGESSIINKNRERLVFGKNKANYIFPVYISLKVVESMNQGIQFISTFRVEKNFKNVVYVLTNSDGTIEAMSSGCMSILGIDNKTLSTSGKTNIEDYLPNIKNQSGLFADKKNSVAITYRLPKESDFISKSENSTTRQLSCKRTEFEYLNGKEKGAYYKIEYQNPRRDLSVSQKELLQPKISNFQFKNDRLQKATFLGEYVGNSVADMHTYNDDEILDTWTNSVVETEQRSEGESGIPQEYGHVQNNDHGHSHGHGHGHRRKKDEEEVANVNYAAGIKTLRLNNGRVQEIEDDNSDKSGEDDENNDDLSSSKPGKDHYINMQGKKQEQEQNPQDDGFEEEDTAKDFNIKSRKTLNLLINDRTASPALQSLRFVANFFSIVLLVIAIMDYSLLYSQFQRIEKKLDSLDNQNTQTVNLMNSLSRMRDLGLLGMGVFPVTGLNEQQLRESLLYFLDATKASKEQLDDQTDSGLLDGHMILLNEPVVQLTSLDGSIVSKGLTQALEAIISHGYQLAAKDVTKINLADADCYFFVYNSLNDLYVALRKSSEYYSMELIEEIKSKETTFLLLLIASILTILITMLLLYPIFYTIEKLRNEILCLFLDIPNRTVKILYNKCETFLSNLQIGEEDEMLSEIEEPELDKTQDDMNIATFIQKKKRRRFKNSGKGYQLFLIQFAAIIAISEAYFLFSFISSALHTKNSKVLANEFNLTSSLQPFYSFLNVAERQLFWDPSLSILHKDSFIVATNNIRSAYEGYTQLLTDHSNNRNLHREDYMNTFNQIMISDPCVSLGTMVNQTDCQTFAALAVKKGMTVALTRQFENLRMLLGCYSNFTAGNNCSVVDLPTNVSVAGATTTQNKIYGLMVTSVAREINKMDRVYIQNTTRIMIDSFKSSFDDRFNSSLTTKLIVFIVFIVALIVVYGVVWQPTIQKINNDMWRTKLMLGMIPLNVIAKIKSVKSYIKRINTNRDLSSV